MNNKNSDIKGYIFSKTVDFSTLNQRISIPITMQNNFYNQINKFLSRGEKRTIRLVLENKSYDVDLINQNFDIKKYPTHKDMLQIRYTPKSEFSIKLKEIFFESNSYITEKKKIAKTNNDTKLIKLPAHLKETIVIYESEYIDTFIIEEITMNSYNINRELSISEEEYELGNNIKDFNDVYAKIVVKEGTYKIRKLNRHISDCLKEYYDYHCQICAKRIGDIYNVHVIESHHIEPFSTSQNNSTNNQIIICPNHHRIIHTAKPNFIRKELTYLYENGYKESLMLNKHL